MTKNNDQPVSSDPTVRPCTHSADLADPVLPHLGRRVVDMSSINSQMSHKSTVCYPPAKPTSRKDGKKEKKGHKKTASRVSGEHQVLPNAPKYHARERRNSAQDQQSVPRERRNSAQDQQSVPKEQRNSAQDQQSVPRERRNSAQDQQSVPRERRNSAQDQQSVPRERRNSAQDQQSVVKDTRTVSQTVPSVPVSASSVSADKPCPAPQLTDPSSPQPTDMPKPEPDLVTSQTLPVVSSGQRNKIRTTNKKTKKHISTPKKANTKPTTSSPELPPVSLDPSSLPCEPKFAPAAPGTKAFFQTHIHTDQNDQISLYKHPRRMHVNSGPYNAISRSGTFKKTRSARHALKHTPPLHARNTSKEALADRIADMFLFQSWHARQWIKSIGTISEDYLMYMERAIPTVQAKLYSDFEEEDGTVRACVVEHNAQLRLTPYPEGHWRTLVTELSNQAAFSTEILNNILTEELVSVFRNNGVNLFAQGRGDSEKKKKKEDLFTHCEKCQKTRCEHVGALILIIAQHIEENPMFLLRLRGCSPEKLNKMLRLERSAQAVDPSDRFATNYELPASRPNYQNFYTPANEHLYDLQFNVTSDPQSTLLERLNDPSAWQAPISLNACLMPLICFAARDADELYHANTASHGSNRLASTINDSSMPNIGFLETEIPQNIIAGMSRDLTEATYEILTRLAKDGATDCRTLARQTRIKKEVVELILEALIRHQLICREDEDDKQKFVASFVNNA